MTLSEDLASWWTWRDYLRTQNNRWCWGVKGGLDERELEHRKKRTLFELACPTDDLS